MSSETKIDFYVCNVCEKKFSTKNSLIVHLNSHSFGDNDIDEKNESQNTCNICSKKFTAKKNLLKHLRDVHKNYSEAERMVVKKIKCPERNCEFLCRMMKELRNHIEKCHKIKILKDTLQFPSEAVFQKWKKEEESNTISWFVTGRKKTTLTDGTKKQTLYCHRTGHYSPKGFGKYRMRSVGSCKIGVTCPAAMEVTESAEGELTVIYYKTHLGHMQDVVYLKLTREERGHLAEKIKQGFSFDAILEDVKESKDASNEKKKRIHLLSKKDLYSIMYRSKNGSKSSKKSKQFKDQTVSQKALNTNEQEGTEKNMSVEDPKDDRSEEKNNSNLNFYPLIVNSKEQPEDIPNSSNVPNQKKGHRDVNIPQTSTKGVASQIVILSPDTDYSSVAEIILLSTNDGAPAQPTAFPQSRIETTEHQEGYMGESQMSVVSQVLSEQKTKVNKSNLYLQLKEKLQKVFDYLPQCEHLTPKQFDLINTKLDSILDIFNVANEKAKTKKQSLRKRELKDSKTLVSTRTGAEKTSNLDENQQQLYDSSFIYAVYN